MEQYKNLTGNVYFIETMGVFDGPGIRYVLFLQGCPLRCKFCHNRDSWSTEQNKLMTVDEVLKDYNKLKGFYKKGGITVSGGEPTLQLPFLTELFKACKKQGIHTCLDTSAGTYSLARQQAHIELLKYTDLVLLDIKHIDNEKHKDLVGIPNTQVLKFAELLDELQVDTIIRHVYIPTINDDDESLLRLRAYIDTLTNIVGIDILPYHKAGITKWDKLAVKYPLLDIEEPTKDNVKRGENILKTGYKFKKTTK